MMKADATARCWGCVADSMRYDLGPFIFWGMLLLAQRLENQILFSLAR